MTTQFDSLTPFTAIETGDEIAVARGSTTGRMAISLIAGGEPVTGHDLIAGWSADTTISDTELDDATATTASSATNSLTIPTATGNQHLFVWRADADGGDPSEVHIAGGGNSRNVFGTAVARTVDGTAGQLIVTVGTLNASVNTGETLRVV